MQLPCQKKRSQAAPTKDIGATHDLFTKSAVFGNNFTRLFYGLPQNYLFQSFIFFDKKTIRCKVCEK